MEAATIVRYHPETNENIYTYKPAEPKLPYEPPKRTKQPEPEEAEVRLDKENKTTNKEEAKKAAVPREKG